MTNQSWLFRTRPTAHFWTVYAYIPGESVQAIDDYDTREHAEEVFTRFIGRKY